MSTYQIICTIPWNLNVVFPASFSAFISSMSFLKLKFLNSECLESASSSPRYFIGVIMISLIPIAIGSVLIAGKFMFPAYKRNFTFAFFLLTQLVLPPCSMVQFEALHCATLATDETSYLYADSSIDCSSASYKSFRGAVIAFIFVYQSIPICWLILLLKKADRLNPPYSNGAYVEELDKLLERRNADLKLMPTRFLWSVYRPNW